jgi:3alpha(or 20beta)-hydroxysteroid dehydrogenase
MARLDGKVALVTGAARGTGAAIAARFAAEGARVVLTDVLDELGRSTAAEIGDAARYIPLDVTDPVAWSAAVSSVEEEFGGIDVLVNNAAILHLGSVLGTDLDTWNRVVAVNQTGTFLGIQSVIEPLVRRNGGSIINIASIDGLIGMNGVGAYAASKWAVRGLTRVAAIELGRAGIRVNTICPAGGNAEMGEPWRDQLIAAAAESGASTATQDDKAIPHPLRFEDITGLAVFLASDESAYCTGSDFTVDGGRSAGHYVPLIQAAFPPLVR